MEEEEDAIERKLKAAAHYHVAKICEQEARQLGIGVNRQAVAALNELLLDLARSMGGDVESFARHAKRNIVNADDVKLCARRSPSLMAKLDKKLERLCVVSDEKKAKRSKKRKGDEQTENSEAQVEDSTNSSKSKRTRKASTKKAQKQHTDEEDTAPKDDEDTEDW